MNCLLCDTPILPKETFSSILLMQSKKVYICEECQTRFERIKNPHCPTCCKSGIKKTCQDCLYWQDKGQEVCHRALFTYNDMMKDYFSRYKFQGDYLLRKVFSDAVKSALKNYPSYTIVPIPLSADSLQKRKFNQVTGFLEDASIAYCPLLKIKEKNKVSQSSKTREERLATQQFFTFNEEEKIPDKVLLVDDIYTTGATLMLARQILCEKGVKIIKTFSLAR